MSLIINPYVVVSTPSFLPSDEPTLDWWMKADSISGSDGDPVTSWSDSSSAARHYSQSTGSAQPTLKLNIVNGKPVVRFATNDKLGATATPRTLGTTNTMFIVCTPTTTGSGYLLGGSGGEGGPAIISGFGGKSFEYFFASGGERATFSASTSGFHILSLTRTDSSGNYVGYLDAVQVFSNSIISGSNWNSKSWNEIGANGTASGEDFFNGDIAEIIHCSSVLGSTALGNMHTYLKTKYGIA